MILLPTMRGVLRRNAKTLPLATYVGRNQSTTTTIAKPSGLAEGDLMFVHHPHAPESVTLNGGSGGWSKATVNDPTYGYYAHLFWKVVTADDVAATLALSGQSSYGLTSLAYRGPIAAVLMGSAVSGSGSTSTLSLDRSAKNSMSLGQMVITDDRDVSGAYGTAPAGWTSRTTPAAEYFRISCWDLIDGSQPGGSGTDTFTGYATTYPQKGFNVELRGDAGDLLAFDPSQLSTIKAWWSPDYGITKDGSNRVSAWADKIGGHTPVQATTAAQPLWVANASSMLGGTAPLVYMDSNARFLEMTAFPSSFPTGTDETWIWGASRMTATGSDYTPAILGYGSNRGIGYSGSLWNATNSAITNQFAVMRSGGSDAFQAPPSMITNAIVGARFGSVGIRGRRNGAQVGTSSDGTSITTGNLRIGRRTNGNDNIIGYVGDIIVTGALTIRESQKLEAWLAWKYGQQASLPSTHPFKAAPP